MKSLLLAVFILIGASAYCQESKSGLDQKKIKFGFGYNMDLEVLKKYVAEGAGFSQFGFNFLDIYGNMTILKYLSFNLGVTLGSFKDKSDLTQTVVATGHYAFSNIPFEEEYKIYTYGIYLSGGSRINLFSKLNLVGNFGYRGFSALRTIPDCKDCETYKAGKDASFYIQPGLEWILNGDKESGAKLSLLYSYYINSPFSFTLTFGLSIF